MTILNDVNLEIEKGEIVSILGPSGCGKTTLLNLILGMTDADSGSILLEGEDITRVPMEKRGFNIVFQDYALFPNLNVYQNITYGLIQKKNFRLHNHCSCQRCPLLLSAGKLINFLLQMLSQPQQVNELLNLLFAGNHRTSGRFFCERIHTESAGN